MKYEVRVNGVLRGTYLTPECILTHLKFALERVDQLLEERRKQQQRLLTLELIADIAMSVVDNATKSDKGTGALVSKTTLNVLNNRLNDLAKIDEEQ